MRNEIYARHGYIFERKSLDTYFRAQSWYHPVTHDFNAMLKALPPADRDNVTLISSALKRAPAPTLSLPPHPVPTPPAARTPVKQQALKRPKAQTALDHALVEAVRSGAVPRVRSLLQQGADPNTRDAGAIGADGAGPLLLAARSGDTATGELLLKAGGDAAALGPGSTGPVTEAIKYGHPLMVKLMMEWGAKDVKRVAFLEALTRADVDSLSVLLAHGDTVRKTDLIDALAQGTFSPGICAVLLAKGADVNAKDARGATPLMYAASLPGADAAAFLLAHGADIKAADNDGWTPLHHSAFGRLGPADRQGLCSPAAARALVDAQANVNARDKTGATPLIRLAECIAPTDDSNATVADVAKLLIGHGAKINAKDTNGRTALMASAAAPTAGGKILCSPSMAKLLAAVGADVNLRDNAGNTALMRVAQADGDESLALSFARTLLLHGALPSARNDGGETAALLARKHRLNDLARLLENSTGTKQ